MSLFSTDIAELGALIKSPPRISDPDARALAKQTKEAMKAEALESAKRAAEAFHDYTPSQHQRIAALREVHWPRARAIANEVSATRARIAAHFDSYDDTVFTQCELYDLIFREYRLSVLLTRAYAASAAIGRFPISRADMRTDKRTRFLGSAAARHFTFKGGRDWGSAEFDPADIVQGAFVRALENGDSVSGVPTFGSMFRWIQTERAHLTRVANAEFGARKAASLGWTTRAVEEWPEVTDKHNVRLLGTRKYATLEQHRESLAIAHREAEMAVMDDAVTASAREDELSRVADRREFHVVLARVLMGGATLAEVADALGLKPDTIKRNAMESAAASLLQIGTGLDHSERSIDLHNAAEREREQDEAEARHAARLREIEVRRATVLYASRKVA